MSQWQNPPRAHGFSADPSNAPHLRPSDADRAYADSTLRAARAEGRITETELAERVDRTASVASLGELQSLIADVSLPTVAAPDSPRLPVVSPPRVPAVSAQDVRRGMRFALPRSVVSWLFLAILFNVIWLFSSGPGSYYWPVWPMLGTGIPVIGLIISMIGGPGRADNPRLPTDLR